MVVGIGIYYFAHLFGEATVSQYLCFLEEKNWAMGGGGGQVDKTVVVQAGSRRPVAWRVESGVSCVSRMSVWVCVE